MKINAKTRPIRRLLSTVYRFTVYRLPSTVLLLAAFSLLLSGFFFPGSHSRESGNPLRDSALAWRAPTLASAAPSPSNQIPPSNGVIDSPLITIAGATATSGKTPTSGVGSVRVIWSFGTVLGTYTGCTVQAQSTYDNVNFLNLGGAEPITVTSGTLNAWGIYELPLTAGVQFPTDSTGIAVTPVSTNVATSFGQAAQFVFACTGYGTSAPANITVIYR